MRREAKCRDCGARYMLKSEKVPKVMRCFCESRSFQLMDMK